MTPDTPPARGVRALPLLAVYFARKLAQDRAPEMAAALAYRTMFSLIPVLVMALVIVKAFFGPERIREGFRTLMEFSGLQKIALSGGDPAAADGANETAQALSAWIEQFVNKAVDRISGLNYGAITIVGAALLIYSAISLLISVEQTFNAVCRAASGRRLGARLTNYWTLLTLGSIALIGSFTLTGWYARRLSDLPTWAAWASGPLQLAATVGITWLLLILAYTRMPNARMKLRPAAAGAFVAAVLWETLKWGLAWFVKNMTGGQVAIYGSLALVPLFVLWVYVTWLIVILGLEIAWVAQTVGPRALAGRLGAGAGRLVDPNASLLLARLIARDFAEGRQPTVSAIALRARMAEETVQAMVERMALSGILARVQRGGDDSGWTLARPPGSIRLADVLASVESLFEQPQDDDAVIPALCARQLAAVGDQTLESLA